MKFSKRKSAPAADNKYYYSNINPWTKKGIGSCTRYAQGRIMECTKDTKRAFKDTWYPIDMISHCAEVGAKQSSVPTLGGYVVWASDNLPTGHVGCVEQICSNMDIYVSQMSSKEVFSYVKLTKKSGYQNGEYKLVAFCDLQVKWDENSTTSTEPKQEEATKKELKANSYPNYTNGKYYRIRKSWKDIATQKGAYAVWEYGFRCWQQNKADGYHIYDCNGNKLD